MDTIPLSLDGYTDLPPGKIANVVTYLERFDPPAAPAELPAGLVVRPVPAPAVAWYRDIFRRVGEDWLWTSLLHLSDDALAARLAQPARRIFAIEKGGAAIGYSELDFSVPGEAEIEFFGVVAGATGTGAARALMDRTLAEAFRPGVRRVWLHTCTFDHPAAVRFYRRAGFAPYKFAVEVMDDPRLAGLLPETAAPHVGLVRTKDAS